MSLELCTTVREFTEDDRTYQYRFTGPRAVLDVDLDALEQAEKSQLQVVAARAGTPG